MSRARLPNERWSKGEWDDYHIDQRRRYVCDSFTWNPPNVPANDSVDTTLTTSDDPALAGLIPGMVIALSPPSDITAGLVIGAVWCATADTLTVRLVNPTGGAINQGAGSWSYRGELP